MNRIRVLDRTTVDKIAAGEVVESPASVVKELVENAIDAGSTRITVELQGGGSGMIRVTDNGGGISGEDIPVAFLPHATSKIKDADDLMMLSSLGFRGEALSSICAVSRVELITRREDDLTAWRYVIEGGQEMSFEEIGAPCGTTIIVRDLFYNTPARAKFLKSSATEAARAGAYVEQLVMSNPGIAFSFIVNGRQKITSPGSGKLSDAIYGIYGKEVFRGLVPVSYEKQEEGEPGKVSIGISGMIGQPRLCRGNRDFENYYVNGRYIKSRVVSKAIEDGYGTTLMQHQYPFTCIMLSVSGGDVDVNVHPTKMEVRFSDEKAVYEAVREAVASALSGEDMTLPLQVKDGGAKAEAADDKEHAKRVRAAEPFERGAAKALGTASVQGPEIDDKGSEVDGPEPVTVMEQVVEPAPDPDSVTVVEPAIDPEPVTVLEAALDPEPVTALKPALDPEPVTVLKPAPDPEPINDLKPAIDPQPVNEPVNRPVFHYEQQSFIPEFFSDGASGRRNIVGCIFKTYWIFEYEGKVYVLDQHAAHEKVLFERFMRAYEERESLSQPLMPPMIVTLSAKEEALLEANTSAFGELGFEIEHFGERDYAVRAVPYSLGTIDSAVLFREFLDQLDTTPDLRDMKLYIHTVATEACKAAVKGGGRMSAAEAEALIDDLMKCEDPYHCPHGRPTIMSFTRRDVEKLFKRIV